MEERYTFETSFTSELYRVKQTLKEVMGFITEHLPQLSSEEKSELKLIYSELLCNAVIHGNKQNISKYVRLYVSINEGVIFSSISDEGLGFDHLKLLSEINNPGNPTREHGRGIRLVYSLADKVSFNLKGNEIKFHKRMSSNV